MAGHMAAASVGSAISPLDAVSRGRVDSRQRGTGGRRRWSSRSDGDGNAHPCAVLAGSNSSKKWPSSLFSTTASLPCCTDKTKSSLSVIRSTRRVEHVSGSARGHRSTVAVSASNRMSGGRAGGSEGGGPSRMIGLPSLNVPLVQTEPYLPFRPPPGFSSDPSLSGTPEDHLNVLREGRATWHELAPFITALGRSGLTPAKIDEATGYTGVEQNNIIVGAQVYNSLKASGVAPDVLAQFDVSGAAVLYELRILSNSQRKSAAEYVISKGLDGKGARDLARAIKDHERKRGGDMRRFFSAAPGDCLAFAYYRQARECTDEGERSAVVEKGMEHAVSDSARRTLQDALSMGGRRGLDAVPAGDGGNGATPLIVMSKLEVHRLSPEEVSARAIPVVGDVAEVNEDMIYAAPCVGAADGPFSIFSVESAGRGEGMWTVLPAWRPLVQAASPVALTLSEKAAEDLRPMLNPTAGPVLLIIDRVFGAVSESCYYVQGKVSVNGGEEGKKVGVSLVSGRDVLESGSVPCGRVLMGVKAPMEGEGDEY